ncbi:hypothetical protein MPSEU_000659300 [Mayamaea pseudoterrestris]|nr:hypothetical protein MPSEU_000659300 [Mayamaea pseudoterrestris]
MKASLSQVAISLLLVQTTTAFLTVQKRDRPNAFATNGAAAASSTVPNANNNHKSPGERSHKQPSFLAASHAGGHANPFAVAYDYQDFTPWQQDATDDDSMDVDLSYSTILMACALSMALGFGLGYGT